jgi:hypothetical protein
MKVKELIAELRKLDPERIVILQKDPEGNGYSPLEGVEDNATWQADDKEVRLSMLTPDLAKQGFTLEDVGDGELCVVLYP